MKRVLFLLVFSTCLFAGCFETNEEITITDNGSGVYRSSMDMSAMFNMIDQMKQSVGDTSNDSKAELEKEIDSVFLMKDFVDTASGLTEEQKRLMRPAKLHIIMNEKERKVLIEMTYPYSSLSDLEKIMQAEKEGKGLSALGRNKSIPGMDQDVESEENPTAGSPFGNLDKMFRYTFKDGMLARSVIKDSMATIMQSKELEQMGKMKDMLAEVKFNLAFQLPRPAKNISGSRVKLSADKKKVTVNTSMKDLFEDPMAFDYHIKY